MPRETTSQQDKDLADLLVKIMTISIDGGDVRLTVDGSEIVEWVRDNCDPTDVFSDAALEMWAEENDWVRNDA